MKRCALLIAALLVAPAAVAAPTEVYFAPEDGDRFQQGLVKALLKAPKQSRCVPETMHQHQGSGIVHTVQWR